jgi:hypothetical protein
MSRTTLTFTREEIDAMRDWIADCQWGEGEDDGWIDDLSDQQVIRGVARHYDGGTDGFRRDYNAV